MYGNVMAVHPLEDAPVLELAIKCLVPRPGCQLHAKILNRIAAVVGTLDLVQEADVATVGFDALARLKEVGQDVIEEFDIRPGTSGVWPPNPHQIPGEDVYAKLIS